MSKHTLILAMVLAALLAVMVPGRIDAQTYLLQEGFEGITSGVPAGWDNSEGTTTNVSHRWTSYSPGHVGQGLRFDSYINSGGSTSILKTPTLDLSEGGILSFWFKNPTGGDFSVYISTDDGATYRTPIVTGLTGAADWTYYESSITSVAQGSSTAKVVFYATSNYGNGDAYIYLDDVSVTSAPTCATPKDLYVSSLAVNSATLHWDFSVDGAIPGSYTMSVLAGDGSPLFKDKVAAGQSHTLTGLAPNTTYIVQLEGDCQNSFEGFSEITTCTFTTPCLPAAGPYYEDFAASHMPDCIYTQNAALSTSVQMGSTGHSLALTSTSTGNAYIVFPELTVPSDSLEVEFYLKTQSVRDFKPQFQAGLVTDLADIGGTFEPLKLDSLTTANWTLVRFNTLGTINGSQPTSRVCIFTGSGNNATYYLDNVDIHHIPSCIRPEDLAVADFTATTVSLGYTEANATNYDIMVIQGTDTTYQHTTGNLCVATGLTPNTKYEFRLRGNCGGGDYSAWSRTSVSASTACVAATSPYFDESFETMNEVTGAPECWAQGWITKPEENTYAVPFVQAASSHSGTKGFALAKQTAGSVAYLSSQAIPVDAAGAYDVALWVRRDDAAGYESEQIEVWVNTVPYTTVGGTHLGTISRDYRVAPSELSTGWYRYIYPINTTGTLYVVLVGTSQDGAPLIFDDVAVVPHESCTRVTSLVPNRFGGPDGLDWSIDWTGNSGETTWQVDYVVNGTAAVATVTTPRFVLPALQPNTSYSISVSIRAVCAPGDTSEAAFYSDSFNTACAAATEVFYDAEDATFPPACWQIGSTSTNMPSRSTWGVHAGSYAVSFPDQQQGNCSWLVSPLINFGSAGSDSTVFIDFWFQRSSYGDKPLEGIEVYVGQSESYENDTKLMFIPREFALDPAVPMSGVYNYRIQVPNTFSGFNYVVFRYVNQYGLNSCLDDILITREGSCPRVKADITNVTNEGAEVNVAATGLTVQTAYGPQGTEPENCTIISTPVDTTAANTAVAISGLSGDTEYSLYVRVVCQPGDTSAWSNAYDFRTACNAQPLPIFTDFESATFPEQCWQIFSTTSNMPQRSSRDYAATSGTYVVYFPDQNSGNNSMLTSPLTHFDADSTYLVSFSAYRNQTSKQIEGLYVYVSDVANDVSNATLVCSVPRNYAIEPVEAAEGVYEYSFRVPAGISGNKYVVFCYRNEYGSGMSIDDIYIASALNCLAIKGTLAGAGETTASISTDAGIAHWQIAYGTAGTPLDSMTIVDVNDTSLYTITGLTGMTAYTAYVRAICNAGDTSAWSRNAINFRTTAVALPLPYVCGFEDQTQNSQWTIENNNNSNLLGIGSASAAVGTGDNALYVQSGNVYSYNKGVNTLDRAYVLLHFEPMAYQVEFQWRCTGGESDYDYGRVMLLPGSVDPSVVTSYNDVPDGAIEFGQSLDANGAPRYSDHRLNKTPGVAGGWNYVSQYVDMTNRAGNYYLLVMWKSDTSGGTDDPLSVDNINIFDLSCVNPRVAVSGLTADAATLNYSSADALQYEVIVDNQPISTGDITAQSTYLYRGIDTVGQTALSQLTPNTTYYYVLRSFCQNGDTAAWSAPATFTTLCLANVPYLETYEDPAAMNCWSTIAGQPLPGRSIAKYYQGNASMQITSTQAISPAMNVDSLNRYMITGFAMSETAGTQIGIGLMTDPTDFSTYETFGNVTLTKRNLWTEFTVYFDALDDDEYASFRSARNIVLSAPLDVTIYVDNVQVMERPACARPTEPDYSNVTATSFDLGFTDNASATSWAVRLNGRERVITSNPATISGLDAHTTYDVYVAAICGAGDTSAFAYFGRVITACDTMDMPYRESFETTVTEDDYHSNGIEEICWNQINASAGKTHPYYYAEQRFASDGLYALKMTGSGVGLCMILPPLRGLQNCELNFSARFESPSECGDLYVGYMTDYTDLNSFTAMYMIPRDAGYMAVTEHELNLYGIPAGARLAFYYYGGHNSYFVWLDNIRVNAITSCTAPALPTVSHVADTHVDVSFNDTCSAHNAWEYTYGAGEFNAADTAHVRTALNDTTAFTLTGLTANTAYYVAVRSICGAGEASPWRVANFTTSCEPFAVTLNNTFLDSYEDGQLDAASGGCYQIYDATLDYAPGINSNYAHNGSKCVFISNKDRRGLAISRDFYFEAGHHYEATVWAFATYMSFQIELFVAPQFDVAHLTRVGAKNLPTCPNGSICYDEVAGTFTVPVSGVYTVGVRGYETGWGSWGVVYFDDFQVREYTCPTLRTAPRASQPTATTAIVNVDLQGYERAEIGWAPAVGTVSPTFIQGSVTTTTATTTATGLNPGTAYAFFYRIICSEGDTSTWSPASAAITTFADDCFAMQDMAVRSITDESLCFGWRSAPNVVTAEYELLLHDSVVVASGTTTADTVLISGLNSATTYKLRVRGICSASDTSDWAVRAAITAAGVVDAPFVCDFEDTDFDHQWVSRSLVGANLFVYGTDGNGRKTGSRGLYVSNNGGTYQYSHGDSRTMAVMRVNIAPGEWMISYDWKCAGENGNDGGRFFLVPDDGSDIDFDYSTIPANAIALEPNSAMTGMPGWSSARKIFTITEAGVYRLVAAWVNNAASGDQPPLALDNVVLDRISCAFPKMARVTATTATSATAVVVRDNASTPVEYAVTATPVADSTAVWTSINTTAARDTIAIAGLNSGTVYYLHVRHVCGAQDVSPVVTAPFLTLTPGAGSMPYVCSFEGTEDLSAWTMHNQSSYYVIGTAEHSDGQSCLYVTTNGTDYNSSSTSAISYAEVPISFTESGRVDYSFDWKCQGEPSRYDYARIFLAPASYQVEEGARPWGSRYYDGLPAGSFALDYRGSYGFNGGGNAWHSQVGSFNLAAPGLYKLVVFWENDGGSASGVPMALDNIVMSYASCPRLTAGNTKLVWTSDNSCVVKVFGNNEDATLGYHVSSTPAFTDTLVLGTGPAWTDTTYITITDLEPGTPYYVRLVSECSPGVESDPFVLDFHTGCIVNDAYPWRESFEEMLPLQTRGVLENNCWLTWSSNGTGTALTRSTVNGNPVANVAHDGTQGLFAIAGTGTEVFGLPMFSSLNGKWLGFWLRNYNDGTATVDYGYLTDPDNGASFVSLGEVAVASDWQQFEAELTGVPDSARLAIRTTGTAYLAFDDFVLHEVITGAVYNDTVCNTADYAAHGFARASQDLTEGVNTFTRYAEGTVDTLITVNVVRLPKIITYTADTICGNQPYNNGIWQIPAPRTHRYQYTFLNGSRNGCDSTVYLDLNVLPGSQIVYDTICGGEIYHFGDQQINSSGLYTRTYHSALGCLITDSLYLTRVLDTITSRVTICYADLPYDWHGQSVDSAGVYTYVGEGQHGCPQTFILTLDVLNLDSTINISFCRGGQAQVIDTVINTAGAYTLERINYYGCDIVYHINATVTDPQVEHVYDVTCEGKTYRGYGLTLDLAGDTVVTINTRTADAQCDSIAQIHITYHPTQRTEFTVAMYTGDTYEWDDVTYTEFGRYSNTYQDQYGCDSVATMNLVCKDGVADVSDRGRIRVVPNPAGAGQAALVFVSGTGEIARVEVINSYGAVIDSWEPHSTPIDLTAPLAAGVYHVRVTTADGRVYVEKLIVR